jgi:hypothetical protein
MRKSQLMKKRLLLKPMFFLKKEITFRPTPDTLSWSRCMAVIRYMLFVLEQRGYTLQPTGTRASSL